MNREQSAREKHMGGYNCANAVYSTFSDYVTGTAPMPRSEGGKCGAVLAAEKVMAQMGIDQTPFDEKFISMFGSLTCADLRGGKYPCNDLVGTAARMTEEAVMA